MVTLKQKTTAEIHQTESIRVRNSKSPPKLPYVSAYVRIQHTYTISPAKPFARRWEKFLSKRRQFKEHDSRQDKLFFWEHSTHWIDKPEYF